MTPRIRTIRSEDDVRAVMAESLRFHPRDSLVVLGVGGQVPHARLDMCDPLEFAVSLRGAALHWRQGKVLLVAVTDEPDFNLTLYGLALEALGVEVALSLVLSNPDPKAVSRDEMKALTRTAATAQEAVDLAWKAYRTGDGALAWCYLDRHEELAEEPDPRATDLAGRLRRCDSPFE